MAGEDDFRRTREALVTIQREMDALSRKGRDAAAPGGGLGMVDASFSRITRTALGGVGLIAVMQQIGQALEGVATKSVAMQQFARDVQISKENIDELRQGMRRLGMEGGQADQVISTLGGKLNDLRANGFNSDLARNLSNSAGGAAFAGELRELLKSGDNMAAITRIQEKFNAQTREGKTAMAQYFGVSESVLENLGDAMRRNIRSTQLSSEEARRYLDFWVDAEVRFGDIWKKIALHGMAASNSLSEHLKASGLSSKSIIDYVSADVDKTAAKIKATIDEIKAIKEFLDDPVKGIKNSELGKRFGFAMDADLDPTKNWNAKVVPLNRDYPQADDPMGADYQAGTEFGRRKVPRLTDFGGMRRSDSVQEEQTSLLVEIRDALLGRHPGAGGGSSAGGTSSSMGAQYAPGGARRNLGSYLGMDRPGGIGQGTAGVGAERGKVGKGEDPRGMENYIREAAKARGIDPDTAVAVAKSEGLRSFLGDGGRSGGAFQLFTGGGLGNEFTKKTGLDPLDPANERATIDFALDDAKKNGWKAFNGAKNTGIGRWAGIGENGITPQPGIGNPLAGAFGGDVRERQGRVAGTRKGALDSRLRAGLDYASAMTGLTVDVTSGGQRMHGAPGAVGSHRHDRGRAADFNLKDSEGRTISPTDPRALEFYRYAGQAGITGGGHSYMSDPTKIHLDISGGVYGRSIGLREGLAAGRAQADKYAAAEAAARARLDAKAKREDVFRTGGADISVDFKGVPTGVTTKVETRGNIFDEMRVSKSRQGEVAGGSPGQPSSGVW